MRKFRKLKIPAHAHPLVRLLTEKMNYEQIGILDLAERSGVNKNTICDWRKRTVPTVDNLDAAFGVLGYELTIRRKPE